MAEPIVTTATWLLRQLAASMWQMAVICSRVAPQTIQSNLKRNIHRDTLMSKVYKGEVVKSTLLSSEGERTLSPIGDMSFLLIFPLSVSPTNSPMESSSLKTSTNGSEILQALIFGLGILPSLSGIICRSVPSGSRTRMALVMTCNIAVRWKNGAAPIVKPGVRVLIETSRFIERTAICCDKRQKSFRLGKRRERKDHVHGKSQVMG